MTEFTGKSRDIYRVRLVLERQRQVQHESEGWINMPADKPETILSENVLETESEPLARLGYERRVTRPEAPVGCPTEAITPQEPFGSGQKPAGYSNCDRRVGNSFCNLQKGHDGPCRIIPFDK